MLDLIRLFPRPCFSPGLIRSLSEGGKGGGGGGGGKEGGGSKERDPLQGIDRKLASMILDEIVDHTVRMEGTIVHILQTAHATLNLWM
jgi:hypothetical protein